jgi:alkylation response protein AidB-like acyl-CoA dehydrogenase
LRVSEGHLQTRHLRNWEVAISSLEGVEARSLGTGRVNPPIFARTTPLEEAGAYANAAKYCAAEAGFRACETAVMTHGGMGYACEYHVERYFREIQIARIAPVSPQLILSHIAERVLGLPKSY